MTEELPDPRYPFRVLTVDALGHSEEKLYMQRARAFEVFNAAIMFGDCSYACVQYVTVVKSKVSVKTLMDWDNAVD
jgi:hypothetical protein